MTPAEEVRTLELSLMTQSVRKDAARVALMLADEFQEFGASGRAYNKAEIIAALQQEREVLIGMKDFECRPIAESVLLVRYRSVRTGEDGVTVEALRSSLWMLREGRWQILFHQGTKVPA